MVRPGLVGKADRDAVAPVATSELVVPRSMPTASRCLVRPRWTCRVRRFANRAIGAVPCLFGRSSFRARAALRRFPAGACRWNISRRTVSAALRSPVLVDLRGEMAAHLRAHDRAGADAAFEPETSAASRASSTASRHSICSIRNSGTSRCWSRAPVDTGELEQVLVMPARDAALRSTRAFVDPRRPLHRAPLLEVGQMGVAVGMDAPLQLVPGLLERAFVEAHSGAGGRRGRSNPASGRCSWRRLQTLKLSPQPHWSLTFGLLNLKPSLRPSRTKSSSVPSR